MNRILGSYGSEEDQVSIASGESRFVVLTDNSGSDEESEMTRYSVVSKKKVAKQRKESSRKHRENVNRQRNESEEQRDPPPESNHTVEERKTDSDYYPIKRRQRSRSSSRKHRTSSSSGRASRRSEKLKGIIEKTNSKPYVPRTITAHHILEDLHSVAGPVKKDYSGSPTPKMKSQTYSTAMETPENCPEFEDIPQSGEKRALTKTGSKSPPMLSLEGLDLAEVCDVIGSPFWRHINNASEKKCFDFQTIKYWTRAAANATSTAQELGASTVVCKSVAVAVLNVSEGLEPRDKESARRLRPYIAMAAEAASRAVVFNGGNRYVGAAVSASVLMSLNEILSLSVQQDDSSVDTYSDAYSSSGLTAKEVDVEIAYEEKRIPEVCCIPSKHPGTPEKEEEEDSFNSAQLDMEDTGRQLYSAATFEADADCNDNWSLDQIKVEVKQKKKKTKKKILYQQIKNCFSKHKTLGL